MSNTFGSLFRITTFGESHGAGIGVIIDGCPAGVAVDAARFRRRWTGAGPASRTSPPRARRPIPCTFSPACLKG